MTLIDSFFLVHIQQKISFLCFTVKSQSYRFGTTYRGVNNDRIFIFGWNQLFSVLLSIQQPIVRSLLKCNLHFWYWYHLVPRQSLRYLSYIYVLVAKSSTGLRLIITPLYSQFPLWRNCVNFLNHQHMLLVNCNASQKHREMNKVSINKHSSCDEDV